MSYEIVKSIKIRDGKVWLKSSESNIYPKIFTEKEISYLTSIFQEKGQEALDIEILKEYESGNFQNGGGVNKYIKALIILLHLPEYRKFNWRINFSEAEKNKQEKQDEFIELLKKALKSEFPKDKFVLCKLYEGTKVYCKKITSRAIYWTYDKIEAKIWNYREDVEDIKNRCVLGKSFQIENLAVVKDIKENAK